MRRILITVALLITSARLCYSAFPLSIVVGSGRTKNASFRIDISMGYLAGYSRSGGANVGFGYRVAAKKRYQQFMTTGHPLVPQPKEGTLSVMRYVVSPDKVMTLEWTDAADLVPVQYNVYFGTNPVTPPLVGTTDKTSYQVANLEFLQLYSWQVEAFDKFGRSTKSDILHFSISPYLEKFYAAPNPFRAGAENTIFIFTMPGAGHAKLEIFALPSYDRVYETNLEGMQNGVNIFTYDGRDMSGRPLFNGVYMVKLTMNGEQGNVSQKHKLMVVR